MWFRLNVVVMLAGFCFASAIACEIRVRDSAFRTVRDVHRLCIIGNSSDPSLAAIEERLQRWLDSFECDVNLKIQCVYADDQETNWRSLGIPSAPPSLPVTVLVGRDNGTGDHFLIDHWEGEPDQAALAALIESPARKQLANLLANHIAVLIFSAANHNAGIHNAGNHSSGNHSAGNADTEPEIAGQLRSLALKSVDDERIGLAFLSIDRFDPGERVLTRFIGLRPDSPDTVCVAFGRGKTDVTSASG